MSSKQQPKVFNTAAETYTSEGIEGQGGTSVVYRVVDSEDKRWALKCLKSDQATTIRTKRFLNELNFCEKSSHKNVIQVFDHGFVLERASKCPFYVMPLYSSTLRKDMKGGLPQAQIMRYFSQILDGVEAAHLHGVSHRDLKPENMLLDSTTGRLIVSDFGIAHFMVEAMHTTVETSPNERLANFQYAAPEQRTPEAVVDRRADIYALGLILNEMFTGQVPQGAGFVQISQVAPEFSYLDDIVTQLVQQSPQKRPSSVDEIKQLLIARHNEFIARQKLDQLSQTVVASTNVVDPLIQNPPKVRGVDIEADGQNLTVELDKEVSLDWIKAFRSIENVPAVQGTYPQFWTFSGTRATITSQPNVIERFGQIMVDNFKIYVDAANVKYRVDAERALLAKEQGERQALQRRIAEEQRRQRILGNIKI